MAAIAILVMHSGKWNDNNCYVDYIIEGIVFKENASFRDLYNMISNQLKVDLDTKIMKIEYKVEQSVTPMVIHNDMGVQVYMMLKRSINDFNRYPICISVMDRVNQTNQICEIPNQEGSSTTFCIDAFDELETQQLTVAELVEPLGTIDPLNSKRVITDSMHKDVQVYQLYKNKSTLKAVMGRYAIANRFQFRTKRNNNISYELLCFSKECDWTMKASNVNKSGMFKIRKFMNIHSCPLKDRVYTQRQATSNLVGGIVMPKLVDHKRKYTPRDIKNDMKIYMGVDVTYMCAWRAKEKALISIRGTPSGSYSKLPAYLYMLDTTYPGSHIRYKKINGNEFLYLFVALKTFIQGFEHCRPVVVVDGSFLRGPYNGTFVAASTMDGAGHIFPLAYGILDSENDASWS